MDADQGRVEAEVDRELLDGEPTFARGAFGSEHGLVRTGTVTGDYDGWPDQPGDGPRFGHSVAIDRDWLAVGAPGAIWTHPDHGTADHGAVFMFQRVTGRWQLQQRITITNTPAGGRCGHAVALHLPYVAFGCPEVDNASGTQTLGWTRVWRLNAAGTGFNASSNHPGTGDGRCGTSLSITEDYLAAGCPTFEADTTGGQVRLYRHDPDSEEFALEAIITQSVPVPAASFGHSVSVNQSFATPARLAVGAPAAGLGTGSVYVFERSGGNWSQTALLSSPSPVLLGFFGIAVDLIRTGLVVGAPTESCPTGNPSNRCGRAHRFALQSGTWQHQEIGYPVNLPHDNLDGPEIGMSFGRSVAFTFDFMIAVGAPNTTGTSFFGDPLAGVGLVEMRRPVSGNNYNVNSYRGILRPWGGIATLPNANFGESISTSFAARRMAVGLPGLGTGFVPPPPVPRPGGVWIYEPDVIFADGFQDP